MYASVTCVTYLDPNYLGPDHDPDRVTHCGRGLQLEDDWGTSSLPLD